jgi:hypothetical protein
MSAANSSAAKDSARQRFRPWSGDYRGGGSSSSPSNFSISTTGLTASNFFRIAALKIWTEYERSFSRVRSETGIELSSQVAGFGVSLECRQLLVKAQSDIL